MIRYKDCGIATELEVTPGVMWYASGLLLGRGLVWLGTSMQTSCSKSFSEENRCLAMEQISKTV